VPRLTDRAGKVKITSLILLALVAGGVYYAYAFGSVYWRRYAVTEAIDSQLAFAGQVVDETIRQQIVQKIGAMNLPPAASRVRMSRPGVRTIQVTIAYTETVNLFYTKKEIPISITRRRTY
jgi:hypothetical protein